MSYFVKMKLRGKLMKAFKLGGIYNQVKTESKTYTHYPKIHDVFIDEKNEGVRFTFTLANGTNPDLIHKQMWVFQQHFGKFLELTGKYKKFILWVYAADMPTNIKYDYESIKPKMAGMKIPILCGLDRANKMNVFDMTDLHHLLLTGTTGSGKSSLIRGIITSIVLNKSPEEVQFILGDLKFSELGIYRRLPHVLGGVFMDAKSLLPALVLIQKEMERRGKLLDKLDLESIYELKGEMKVPSIVVCIDEVILLKDNKKIMSIIESISCVGRSNGVYLMLSMQRGDAKSLGGQLKNNLVFRISGKQSDEINAKISGLKESIDLDSPGRMILKTPTEEKRIQVPFMTKKEAKAMLDPLKVKKEEIQEKTAAEMSDIAPIPTIGG